LKRSLSPRQQVIFGMSASCMTISRSDFLSSNKRRVNPEKRSWSKFKWIWMCSLPERHCWWYPFYIEVKNWDSATCFRSWHFKSRLKGSIFICISWLNGSCFGFDDRGFMK
jgi:hypothetical protein